MSFKDRLKKVEEETGEKKDITKGVNIEEILSQSKPTPFSQDGKRQGEWLKSYEFSEWYYDMDGNPVFISPGYEGDTVGDLYDQNSEFVSNLAMDQNGNYLSVILMTADNKFLEFSPKFEIILPSVSQSQSDTSNKSNVNNINKLKANNQTNQDSKPKNGQTFTFYKYLNKAKKPYKLSKQIR